jgi:hypothetical protein
MKNAVLSLRMVAVVEVATAIFAAVPAKKPTTSVLDQRRALPVRCTL